MNPGVTSRNASGSIPKFEVARRRSVVPVQGLYTAANRVAKPTRRAIPRGTKLKTSSRGLVRRGVNWKETQTSWIGGASADNTWNIGTISPKT